MPRVSIITPCYNVAPYIERMIASVRAQTYTDWELILVDDGSTDNTASLAAQAIIDEPRARLVRQANAGVCAARNAGYRESDVRSDYIYFPDPDDALAPEMLVTMVAYLDAHQDVGFAYCDYVHIDEQDSEIQTLHWPRYAPSPLGVRVVPQSDPQTLFASLYCWAPIPEPVAVMRRSIYERTTGWDGAFGQHGEGVLLFPQFALHSEVHFVPRALYRYRVRPGQSSRVADKQAQAEERVIDWWRRADWLTPEQRAVVDYAEWFRAYRLAPWKGIRAAWRHLVGGRPLLAVRYAGGAARRYVASFLWRRGRSPERGYR